jgi:hypothetical protein
MAEKTATARKKEKKPVETKDEVLLQELQKIRKTLSDVSIQVSKDLTAVVGTA